MESMIPHLHVMNKICQRQLLIEYMIRYGRCLPDVRMLDIIDLDIMNEFGEEVRMFCEQYEKER